MTKYNENEMLAKIAEIEKYLNEYQHKCECHIDYRFAHSEYDNTATGKLTVRRATQYRTNINNTFRDNGEPVDC